MAVIVISRMGIFLTASDICLPSCNFVSRYQGLLDRGLSSPFPSFSCWCSWSSIERVERTCLLFLDEWRLDFKLICHTFDCPCSYRKRFTKWRKPFWEEESCPYPIDVFLMPFFHTHTHTFRASLASHCGGQIVLWGIYCSNGWRLFWFSPGLLDLGGVPFCFSCFRYQKLGC